MFAFWFTEIGNRILLGALISLFVSILIKKTWRPMAWEFVFSCCAVFLLIPLWASAFVEPSIPFYFFRNGLYETWLFDHYFEPPLFFSFFSLLTLIIVWIVVLVRIGRKGQTLKGKKEGRKTSVGLVV